MRCDCYPETNADWHTTAVLLQSDKEDTEQ